jgi:hypothetical protein
MIAIGVVLGYIIATRSARIAKTNDVLVLPLELLFTHSSVNSTSTSSYVLLAPEVSQPRTLPTTQGDERKTEVQEVERSGWLCFGNLREARKQYTSVQ